MRAAAFCQERPTDNESLRRRVFDGEIFLLPATAATLRLTDKLLEIAAQNIVGDIGQIAKTAETAETAETRPDSATLALGLRQAPTNFGPEKIRSGHAAIKETLLSSTCCDELLLAVLTELDFDLEAVLYDPLRLRISMAQGYKDKSNRRANSVHRDTWYANSASQINFWMPLHAVSEADAFGFYLDCFDQPTANTSAQFEYDLWMKNTGWQSDQILSTFPTISEEAQALGEKTSFSAKTGELLVFSAAHLHQTNPNDTDLARYSVDFRLVHTADLEAGRGAPDIDNKSQGNALKDYRRAIGGK